MFNNFFPSLETVLAQLPTIVGGFIVFIIAGSIHEFAHAFVAYMQGDNTAKNEGRLTLNPLSHISIFGTIIFPLFGALTGFPVIGWMKPVPVSLYNLKDGSKGHALVAFAGPFSNLIQAALGLIILKGVYLLSAILPSSVANFIYTYGMMYIHINLLLMAFNLLPIPPLDGNWILMHFSPPSIKEVLYRLSQYGIIILYLLIVFKVLRFYLSFASKLSYLAMSMVINSPFIFSFIPLIFCILITFFLFRGSIIHFAKTGKNRIDMKASYVKQAKKDMVNKMAHSSLLNSYISIIDKLKSEEMLDEKELKMVKELKENLPQRDSSVCDEADFNHNDDYCQSCDSFKICIIRMVEALGKA